MLALRPTSPDGPPPDLEPLPGVVVGHLSDLAGHVPHDRLVDITPPEGDDLAAFFHTGGTTGLPKLAAHTHANEIADAWAVAAMSELDEDAPVLAALPLFHVNALVVTLLAPLLRGRPVVWAGPLGYRDTQLIAAFWRVVEHYGVAAMSGVPSVYAALAGVPVDADISSLRLCIVGAAPLPKAVADAWHAHTGRDLVPGYGLTEATCASTRGFPDHPVPGTVGQRLPYQTIKAVESTRPPAPGGTCLTEPRERSSSPDPPSSPATSSGSTPTARSWTGWASLTVSGSTPATWAASPPTASSPSPGGPRT